MRSVATTESEGQQAGSEGEEEGESQSGKSAGSGAASRRSKRQRSKGVFTVSNRRRKGGKAAHRIPRAPTSQSPPSKREKMGSATALTDLGLVHVEASVSAAALSTALQAVATSASETTSSVAGSGASGSAVFYSPLTGVPQPATQSSQTASSAGASSASAGPEADLRAEMQTKQRRRWLDDKKKEKGK